MINVAIIPARSGSKGLPGKNLKKINGLTLIEIALKGVIESGVYEHIIFTSDSAEYLDLIKLYAKKHNGLICHLRDENQAKDNSEVDAMMIHVVDECMKQNLIPYSINCLSLFYPTSPGRTARNITDSYTLFKNHKPVIGVVPFSDYIWKNTPYVHPVNYNPLNRKSRHLHSEKYYRESKSLYHFSYSKLKETGSRLYEPPVLFEVTELEGMDIDNEIDFNIFTQLCKKD